MTIEMNALVFIGIIGAAVIITLGAMSLIASIDSKLKKNAECEDMIILFGVPITISDYMSVIQTLAAYLVASVDNMVDLKDFIEPTLLRYPGMDSNFTLIEDSLNALPIVACTHLGKGKYVINENALVKKYEKYQKQTQRDEYIIPLFQADVVNRNPNLFNFSTRFQQTETTKILVKSEMVSRMLTNMDRVIERQDTEIERNYIKDYIPVESVDIYDNEYDEYENSDYDEDYYEEEDEIYIEDEDYIEGQIDLYDYASYLGLEIA